MDGNWGDTYAFTLTSLAQEYDCKMQSIQPSNAKNDAKQQWECEREETLEELALARQQNVALGQELQMAVTEAVLAQDALEYCVARAQTELSSEEEAKVSAASSAVAQADAEALVEALVAAEMALEIALDQRSAPTICSVSEASSAAEASAKNRSFVETLSSSCRPTVSSDEARMAELEEQVASTHEALASMQSRNTVLSSEMAQRDAEWHARVQAADAEVARLRQGLADAWAENAVQADEFVDSLTQVQNQLCCLEGQQTRQPSLDERSQAQNVLVGTATGHGQLPHTIG